MNICELLPIGSVVLLKDAQKKIVIIGVMQIKLLETGDDIAYDYAGVPYPEGLLGQESILLFNHNSIQCVNHHGFSNYERDIMLETIEKLVTKTDETIASCKERV